jgi:hypothetical protein
MLHTLLHVHDALTRTSKGEAWKTSKRKALSEMGEHGMEKYFYSFFFRWLAVPWLRLLIDGPFTEEPVQVKFVVNKMAL